MTVHNLPSLKARRKELRATMTPAEIRLWQALKQRQPNNLKFRRQHSMGPFIVDFYCPSANLVVELDGSSHDSEEAWRHDERRTAYLESLGLKVTRFENQDVMNNLEGVLAEIARITTPPPLLAKEGKWRS